MLRLTLSPTLTHEEIIQTADQAEVDTPTTFLTNLPHAFLKLLPIARLIVEYASLRPTQSRVTLLTPLSFFLTEADMRRDAANQLQADALFGKVSTIGSSLQVAVIAKMIVDYALPTSAASDLTKRLTTDIVFITIRKDDTPCLVIKRPHNNQEVSPAKWPCRA